MIPDKVKNALKILEKYNKWKNKYVCFSGGKDSLVCLDLCHNAWDNFKVIYIEITGNTHPKCTKYVRKVANEYNAELIHIKYWDVLGGAGNCIICPAMKKTEFLAVAEHCPEIFCRWKEVHEKLKKDYNNNTLRGMRVVFHKFDEWYETYCKNTSLNDFIR